MSRPAGLEQARKRIAEIRALAQSAEIQAQQDRARAEKTDDQEMKLLYLQGAEAAERAAKAIHAECKTLAESFPPDE